MGDGQGPQRPESAARVGRPLPIWARPALADFDRLELATPDPERDANSRAGTIRLTPQAWTGTRTAAPIASSTQSAIGETALDVWLSTPSVAGQSRIGL
jgi:hypothetical protein